MGWARRDGDLRPATFSRRRPRRRRPRRALPRSYDHAPPESTRAIVVASPAEVRANPLMRELLPDARVHPDVARAWQTTRGPPRARRGVARGTPTTAEAALELVLVTGERLRIGTGADTLRSLPSNCLTPVDRIPTLVSRAPCRSGICATAGRNTPYACAPSGRAADLYIERMVLVGAVSGEGIESQDVEGVRIGDAPRHLGSQIVH